MVELRFSGCVPLIFYDDDDDDDDDGESFGLFLPCFSRDNLAKTYIVALRFRRNFLGERYPDFPSIQVPFPYFLFS